MFQTTKAQRKKLARAWREKNYTYVCKAILFHLRLSPFFWFTRHTIKMFAHYTPFAFWLWSEKSIKIRNDELLYKKLLRPGDMVVDAGSNIGLCTLLSASLVGKDGHVFSFEPHPRTYRQLCSNIRLNNFKNITTYNIGLSNTKEKVPFSNEYVSDINHVDKELLEKKQISVQLNSLDNLLPAMNQITLFKLDVEGYELFALQGSKQILQKTKVLYFESSPRSFARQGYSLKDIIIFLQDSDFEIYSLDNNGLHHLDETYQTTVNYEDLMAIKSENLNWFLERMHL